MSGKKVEIKEGDKVLTKGKRGKELQATVVSVTGRYCKVEHGDGTKESILKKDVKSVLETSTRRRRVRSQTRKETRKSLSDSKSRSSSRSRSRSRNRNVAPTRTERKSTGNAVSAKDSYTLPSSVHKDVVLTRTSVRLSSKLTSVDSVRQMTPKPSTALSGTKQLLVSSDSEPETPAEKEKDAKIPKKQLEAKTKTKLTFLWTVLWALQFLLLPALAIFVRLTCTKSRCTIMEVPPFPKYWATYFDLKIALIYTGWIVLQGALMLVPFGNMVKSFSSSEKNAETILKYRLNGFIALLVNCAIYGILAYLKQPLEIVYNKFLQLMIASIIFSNLFAFFLHVRRFLKRKEVEITNLVVEEFSFFGKMFNFKVYCYRLGMLAWVTVNLCLLYKSYFVDNAVNFSLLISAACQLFYVADIYWREETLLTTASFQQDKLDYFMIIRLCTFVPFISAIPLMYIITYNPKTSQNWWLLSSSLFLFVFGYWIYLKSSRGKHIYLKNPHDPSIAYVKRILPSLRQKQQGLFDRIRHPNYFGEFLMHVAWTLPCGFHHLPPYIPVFLTFIYLAKRFIQIENINARECCSTLNKHQDDVH